MQLNEDMERGLTGPVGGILVRRRDGERMISRSSLTTCLVPSFGALAYCYETNNT